MPPVLAASARSACGILFTDANVVNVGDWIPAAADGSRQYNPHNVRPWLLHDHGFAVCVVFASCEQDALDEAADAGKLDSYRVRGYENDYGDNDDGFVYLGNASEPFDIESVGMVELHNPPLSFAALFAATYPYRS